MLRKTIWAVLVLCAAAAVVQADFVTDLAHRWTFENGSLVDDIGGANLTATGSYQITDGKLQSSPGAGYGYLTASINLGAMEDLSIVIIAKVADLDGDDSMARTDGTYNVFLDGWVGVRRFRAIREDSSWGTRIINGAENSFTLGEFHTFSYAYNYGTPEGGAQWLMVDSAMNSGVDPWAGNGRINNTIFAIHNNMFTGEIEEVRIYARALTAAENGQIEAVPEPATMALLTLGGVGLILRKRVR